MDITERKRGENALRASEVRYRRLFESSKDGVLILDAETGIILDANPCFVELLGLSREAFLEKRVWELGFFGNIVANESQFRELQQPECIRYEDKRLETASGVGVDVDFISSVYRVNGHKVIQCNVRDITERKAAAEALRRQEQEYRLLFNSHPSPVWVYDPESLAFLAINDAALTHYGYTREEFLTMTLCDIRPKEDIPALLEAARKSGEELGGRGIWRHRKKNGELILVEIFTASTQFENRDARLSVAIDVTEQKQAEESLREQTDIINRAHDAVIIRDFATGKITFWNRGAEHLYGWSASEALGRPIGELIFAQDHDRRPALEILRATGEYHGELKQVTKDRREIIVDGRASIVSNPRGTPRSVLLINTDITEQKKLETQLLRAQRLESIGTLASGVAHDLNNILTPILICAEVLHGKPTAEDLESSIGLIKGSAQRGAAIVKQVLTFARGVEGERVLIKSNHLIDEMVDIARRTFPKSIEIESKYPDDLWSIEGDPTQLHQVLLNISVNARDAMPTGGTLLFAAENVVVDENYAAMTLGATAGPHIVVRVSDNGQGIPRSVVDKIFEPFFTTKEKGKGTGLGLSTALGIVKSHRGFLSVESEAGRGTTFKIFLPATVTDTEIHKSKNSADPTQGDGEQILVVDDEPNILQITKMIFEKSNYRVLSASDGPEALALFAQQKDSISGVLTDIAMPYMSGVALVRALRKMRPDIPIIASTGQDEQSGIVELESLGVKNFLAKPYNIEKLLETVRHALERRPTEPA